MTKIKISFSTVFSYKAFSMLVGFNVPGSTLM